MGNLLLGLLLLLWGLELLGVVAISSTLLGILALIVGVLFLLSALGVAVPTVPARRVES